MNNRLVTAFFSLLALASAPADAAGQKPANVLDLRTSIEDSNIIFPESFETDTRKLLEGWYMKNYTATDDRYRTMGDVATDDKTIRERLAKLPTVIDLPYNQIVRSYIERYTGRGRAQVASLLGLGNYYMPIFEQALEENGLPLELKYLPVIESGLDPNAVSRHGATGLWQFMLATGRGLGMEVSSLVDERRDPYVSSQKAAQYLKDLYATYGDWSLAIAAYNCGPGAVNKAIRRAGGDPAAHDFWSIYYYLTPETRGYVPMFIAANYVMNYYPEHNISPVIPTKPLVTDTLMISDRVHFNQISTILDIPVDELRVLNPQFRADLIPGTPEHPYTLVLPSQQVHAYLMSENEIKNYEADKYLRRVSAQPGEQPAEAVADEVAAEENAYQEMADAPTLSAQAGASGQRTLTHKVQAGESLASIASLYDVTPEQIKSWNNMHRNSVRVGQMLRITSESAPASAPQGSQTAETSPRRTWTAAEPATGSRSERAQKKPAPQKKQKTAPVTTTHTLRAGDNLSTLSKKYGVSVDELRKANGMKGDNLRAGETIKIPVKGAPKTSAKKGSSKKQSSRSSRKSKKRRR